MVNYNLREVIRQFQRDCAVTGNSRQIVLQKAVAAAIAYSLPVYVGTVDEAGSYYRGPNYDKAITLTSFVNEMAVINTTEVLKYIEVLWTNRYLTLNTPSINLIRNDFYLNLNDPVNLITLYNYWSERFLTAIVNDNGPVSN